MKLTVKRFYFAARCTIGHLLIDGEDSGLFTLEDEFREHTGVPVNEWKVRGKTAIPEGAYKIIINNSVRFKREMPLICAVPGFTGVRIHAGNTEFDTEGCILVGKTWAGADFIGRSREAFDELFQKIKQEKETTLVVS